MEGVPARAAQAILGTHSIAACILVAIWGSKETPVACKRRVANLAGPISLQACLVFISSLVSLAFAGHLGKLPLSQAVLSSSVYNITGAAVLFGLASGMETLCGQVCHRLSRRFVLT